MTIDIFDSIEVGKEFGGLDYCLNKGRLINHLDAMEILDNPWYTKESPYGGVIAPPTACFRDIFYHPETEKIYMWMWDMGSLYNTSIELEFRGPARPGKTIYLRCKVADKYIKKGFYVIVVESLSTHGDGADIVVNRYTMSCNSPERIKKAVTGSGSCNDTQPATDLFKAPAEPKHVENVKKDDCCIPFAGKDTKPGDIIPALSRYVTLETSRLFGDWPAVIDCHTDVREAKKFGYPSVLLLGMHEAAYLSEMCTRFFGTGWINGGKLTVQAKNIARIPGSIECSGVVKEKITLGSQNRLNCDVWLLNCDGEKAMTGTASGIVP